MAFTAFTLVSGRQAKKRKKATLTRAIVFLCLFCKLLQSILLLRVTSTEKCALTRKKFKYKHEMLLKNQWKVNTCSATSNLQSYWGTSNATTSQDRWLPTLNPIPQLDLLKAELPKGSKWGHVTFPFLRNTDFFILIISLELSSHQRGQDIITLFRKTLVRATSCLHLCWF